MSDALLLALVRDIFTDDATLSTLSIGPDRFGYVCEDEDRGLMQRWTEEQIRSVKVKSETAIPVGTYRVSKTWSPKYERLMYLVHVVPGFAGIRSHSGNDDDDTAGCLLPGLTRDPAKMMVFRSREAVLRLEAVLDQAEADGSEIWIAIIRDGVAWDEYRAGL